MSVENIRARYKSTTAKVLEESVLRDTSFSYLANEEGLRLAVLSFEQDVSKLSGCVGKTETF